MNESINILLQTTIEPNENDWHIGRFSMLQDYLGWLKTSDGRPLFRVTARDREKSASRTRSSRRSAYE